MKITNPTNSKISITYRGTNYEIEAGNEIRDIPKEVANYWKSRIHNFIIVSEDTPVVKEIEQNEEKEEVKEEVPVEEKKVTKKIKK